MYSFVITLIILRSLALRKIKLFFAHFQSAKNKLEIPKQANYSILSNIACLQNTEKSCRPLCSINSIYNNTLLAGNFETPNLDDLARFLFAKNAQDIFMIS